MAEIAFDHERHDALERARKAGQPSPADFHVPRAADNYNSAQQADNYQSNNDIDNHHDRLNEARKNESGGVREKLDAVKKLAKVATPMGALSLTKQINLFADMPYVAALGAALLKDLLDFVFGPTVVLAIVFSMLCSVFIFMMMLLVVAMGKKKTVSKFIKKILLLVGGGIVDAIPGIGFFPIETLTVIAIYFLTLVERKNAAKE